MMYMGIEVSISKHHIKSLIYIVLKGENDVTH